MRKVLLLLLTCVLVLVAVVLIRTFSTKSRQVATAALPAVPVSDSVISHLQQAIRFRTISNDNGTRDTAAFAGFHRLLAAAFPLVHQRLERETVNSWSLLFHWKGKQPAAKPIILMAHQDVVPVEESSLSQWSADPFGGVLKDGYVWGRGTVDDKGSLMALLEGAEQLLREGFQPACDVYLAFGHDEEALGKEGAQQIVSLLQQRGIHPAFVLDEGGEVTDHEVPGMHRPVALVGIAEKGYVTLDLQIALKGGHSSMPGKETSIDQLAQAIVALKQHPFPAALNYTVSSFMDYLGPHMPFVQRMAFANRWLFRPMILHTYTGRPAPAAMVRTTTVATLFHAGIKDNIIPGMAGASINFRTLPGVTPDEVIRHVKEVIGDNRIRIRLRPGNSTSRTAASVEHPSFRYLQQVLRGWRPGLIVSPYLVLGATDGRYFTALTPQVYRFAPFNDIQGFHGVNERVGVAEYKKAIGFYYYLIKHAGS